MDRLTEYPFYKDYLDHSNVFRPFVVSFSESRYKSRSLNTDEFGFRKLFRWFLKIKNSRNYGNLSHIIQLRPTFLYPKKTKKNRS
jgi:hypothetical protein